MICYIDYVVAVAPDCTVKERTLFSVVPFS